MSNWLIGDDGKVRHELFALSEAEIDAKAKEEDAKIAAALIDWRAQRHDEAEHAAPGLFEHHVFVNPSKFAITAGTDGWMTIVRVSLLGNQVSFLCRGKAGGGWIGPEMISGWRSHPIPTDTEPPKPPVKTEGQLT